MKSRGFRARLEASLLRIWYGNAQPGMIAGLLLSLLEIVYKSLWHATRQSRKAENARKSTQPPVLVVGNLIAGGAGKTPVVMAVCRHLSSRGLKAGIVSRGYGRNSQSTVLIDPAQPLPNAAEVGDEPLFLCQQTGCPVAVSRNRSHAVQQLLQIFPDLDLIISDDGLQHHRLARQLEWVVFDERAQGNGRLLPAGPLREPISRLASVDAVLCSNISAGWLADRLGLPATHNWHEIRVQLECFRHLKSGKVIDLEQARREWVLTPVAAFTGIANPDKLFTALCDAGIKPEVRLGLPDHFSYPAGFCDQFSQPVLITTGKDAVKLSHDNPAVWVAEIQLQLPPSLALALEECIGSTTD
ncbi:MAG TPA: tetraacyldisaccharide 4'-kinase [Limnobacter sp.]|nr:tetraacyldisaccharide 4'-kinase [Limnobacter sp.]